MNIGIIDYGINNIVTLTNTLHKLDVKYGIIHHSEDIKKYDKLILPGIGSFDEAHNSLLHIKDQLKKVVLEDKKPILGICLGMQLFGNTSQEGVEEGLKFIDGETHKLQGDSHHNIPHIGFNYVENKRYYFSHSYYMKLNTTKNCKISYTHYKNNIVAIIEKNNILGVQFHPETSGKDGLDFLKYFIKEFH